MSKIGLMDCNNFFVSCERLFRPDLAQKPVAVLSSNDGCIVARSQEIKDLGIPMGVPYFKVKDICDKAGAVLFSSNFTLYRDISSRVMRTLAAEVGFCEIYSIDEAFFEVSDQITEQELLELRQRILTKVGLPVSIGVSSTKTLAKQASSIAKKGNGVCMLDQESWSLRAKTTPCGSIWGLGRQTSAKLSAMGVSTVSEFLALDRAVVRKHFGVSGDRIYSELQGVSVYNVGNTDEDIRQSITSSRSFEKTTKNIYDLESALGYHVSVAAEKLREKRLLASKMYLTIQASRHGDYFLRRESSEVILTVPTSKTQALLTQALFELRKFYDPEVPYKKAGVVLSGLMPESYFVPTLFEPHEEGKIDAIVDMINERFGNMTLHSAVIQTDGHRSSMKLRSPLYTTQWKDIPTVRAI